MSEHFSLDPYQILGLSPGASGQEIRDAFRKKSKRHHPDLGGEEWAFRIIVWAYQALGSGQAPPVAPRLFRIGEVEDLLQPSAPEPAPSQPNPDSVTDWAAESERVRLGVFDRDVDPSLIVLVDVIWMRYEVEDVRELLKKTPATDRNLSGTLHIVWPDPDVAVDALARSDAPKLLAEIRLLYEWLRVRPDVLHARQQNEKGRFQAWLTYPSGTLAWQAFQALRPALNGAGLGVKQRTRDVTIPRESKPAY